MTKNYKNLSYKYWTVFLLVSISATPLVTLIPTYAQSVGVGSVVPQSNSTITTEISPLIQEAPNNITDSTINSTDIGSGSALQNITNLETSSKNDQDDKEDDLKEITSKVSEKQTEKWWKWALSYNSTASPITDTTGERCGEGNVAKDMFYLASTIGGSVERSCEITDEQEILLPVLTAFCYVGGTCLTDQVVNDTKQMEEETMKALESVSGIDATLNGKPLNLEKSRVTTELFKLEATSNNPYGLPDGEYKAVADGYFVLLKPLNEGKHELNFKGSLPQFSYETDVTYHLNVVEND